MKELQLFYVFISALMVSTIMIPPISRLSVIIGGIDKPSERKVHCTEIPRLGGIAIFCAFLFSVIFFIDIDKQIKAFLAGAVIIFLTGLVDDLTGLTPRNKLIGEVLAACIAIFSGGITMTTLGNPLGLGEIQLGIFAIPFTVFAVVGVMNAINLIDGLDGLAGGTSAIACLAFGVFTWDAANVNLLALVMALLGAIIGFLSYNTYPARIFMGDSGSLFLGYCMGFFAVMLLNTPGGSVSAVAPLIILGIPILDTLVVMGGRKLNGKHISNPDKTHIHHRLLDLGFGHRFSVLLVYGLSYFLAVSALLLRGTRDSIHAAFLIFFSFLLYSVIYALINSKKVQQLCLANSYKAIYQTNTFRSLVRYSRFMLVIMKYLLLAILTLIIFVAPNYSTLIAWGGGLLLVCMLGLIIFEKEWGNSILQAVVYFSGLTSIFIIENYGDRTIFFGYPLIWMSHVLFACLLITVVVKVVLRKRVGHLMNTRFEYLIIFFIITVSLLPAEIKSQFHLVSVAAKSVILFTGYKLILMRRVRNNRKILAATFISLLALVLRYVLNQ